MEGLLVFIYDNVYLDIVLIEGYPPFFLVYLNKNILFKSRKQNRLQSAVIFYHDCTSQFSFIIHPFYKI